MIDIDNVLADTDTAFWNCIRQKWAGCKGFEFKNKIDSNYNNSKLGKWLTAAGEITKEELAKTFDAFGSPGFFLKLSPIKNSVIAFQNFRNLLEVHDIKPIFVSRVVNPNELYGGKHASIGIDDKINWLLEWKFAKSCSEVFVVTNKLPFLNSCIGIVEDDLSLLKEFSSLSNAHYSLCMLKYWNEFLFTDFNSLIDSNAKCIINSNGGRIYGVGWNNIVQTLSKLF